MARCTFQTGCQSEQPQHADLFVRQGRTPLERIKRKTASMLKIVLVYQVQKLKKIMNLVMDIIESVAESQSLLSIRLDRDNI